MASEPHLQVALARLQQVEQRRQPALRHDARLVVAVLRQAAQRKGRHLAQLAVVIAQHVYERGHGAALHNLVLVVAFGCSRSNRGGRKGR